MDVISMKKSKGFTLLELMIGILILTIAFATIADVFTSITKIYLLSSEEQDIDSYRRRFASVGHLYEVDRAVIDDAAVLVE